MDQLRALRYFAKVVETGSFTRAAEAFSVPPSSLSRRIADLEKNLGANLLKRSTRVVQVTEIGQLYFKQVQDILAQLEQSDETVRSYQAKPTGFLRVSSMVSFGERLLLPLLDEFRTLYPEIILDVSLSDELSTLSRDDVDIAIRGGYAPNERVQAIRLMDNEFIPVAASSYLETMGTPKLAAELKQHKGLFFRSPTGPHRWLCESDGQARCLRRAGRHLKQWQMVGRAGRCRTRYYDGATMVNARISRQRRIAGIAPRTDASHQPEPRPSYLPVVPKAAVPGT